MHTHDDSISDNPSTNPHFNDIAAIVSPSRRRFITATVGTTLASAFSLSPAFGQTNVLASAAARTVPIAPSPKIKLGFKSVNPHFADALTVPPGYSVRPFFRWGDAVSTKSVPFKLDASNTAAEQALQAGMHTDGMHLFPLPLGKDKFSSSRGILCVNHEYADDGLLHTTGFDNWSAEKVAKCQAAMGVSVIEVEKIKGVWRTNLKSRYNRRVSAHTICEVRGPARGDARMQSKTDMTGKTAKGTMSNCAHGLTPWGTYLTCEENFPSMFTTDPAFINPAQTRYGLSPTGANYRWSEFDKRFDAGNNPNEFNHFGWIVEIDPFEPNSRPVKRTAMGRFRHESATMSVAADNRVVIYSGDDAAFEYIYKFVTTNAYNPTNRAANKNLLDEGILYVARFNADGSGEWLALVHGQNGLTPANGFHTQADVVIFARRAADQVGATKMDRPEWIAVHPTTREVYCTLTNNSARGTKDQPGIDALNRRANNIMGSILRWREAKQNPTANTFEWDVFIEAGDALATEPTHKGNINGDAFACPDGLWIDPNGIMWIQTDASSRAMATEPWIGLGNNQMLACDVSTGEVRRFLVGPTNSEITGMTMTPDCRSLFVGIQHPGETPSERSDPKEPLRFSSWPDFNPAGRPRSAVVVISKDDGGVIGT